MNPGNDSPPVGVVIAAHGDLARALRQSAEMIVGAQDDVVVVALNPQDNLETLHAIIRAAMDQADRGAGVIVLIDLFGGTPSNAAALCLAERWAPIIAGVNLPMLLEVLLNRDSLAPAQLAALALESGARGMIDITSRLNASQSIAQPSIQAGA